MYTSNSKHYQRYLCALLYLIGFREGKAESNFDFQTSEFSKIAFTSAFVDKTLLIKEILQTNQTSVIAAPPKFGKSTNLDMIKTFLEIEVDENGRPKSKVNDTVNPVKDTDNFRLFYDNQFKISQETTVMNEYFGRTPVLSFSFKCDRVIQNWLDAVHHFKQVVHQTFKKYDYLLKSEKLEKGQKQNIKTWCDDREYHRKQSVISALRELAEYLYRHFDQRRVFVLIDDHDSAITSATFSVTDDKVLDDIVRFSVCIMNALLKRNHRYVLGALVTGVSDVPAFNYPAHNIDDPDSFQIYRFLDDHQFVDFYGLTREEVDKLFAYPKLKLGENVVEKATAKYGGYLSKRGKHFYNLYSILNFLQTGEFKNYWPTCSPLRNMSDVVKVPFINQSINKLLNGGSINIAGIEEVAIDEVALIRDFMLKPPSQTTATAQRFLFFLIELGYLTHALDVDKKEKETDISVKIPNDEIKEYFAEALKLNE